MRTSVTRPPSMLEPLEIATYPPTATVVASSRNGSTARLSASGSSTVSASITSTNPPDAALIPALLASDLQPALSLSITTTAGSAMERYTPRTGAVFNGCSNATGADTI